jgi:G3E family GTPase
LAAPSTWRIKAQAMALPLTVIGGFLGAGKTTLLKHLLENADGRRLAVLINDFGALNIDAALIKATGTDSIELSNGCVCCSLGDDLVKQLVILEKSADKFNHVIIEASGVGDPWKIAQIGMVAGAYRLDSVIVVVDTETFEELITDELTSDSVVRQLARADIIVANKFDLASELQKSNIQKLLQPHFSSDACIVIESIQGGINIQLALGDYSQNRANSTQSNLPHYLGSKKSEPTYTALSFEHTQPQSQLHVQALFENIPTSDWSKVVRGKALIDTFDGWFEWHKVGTRESWVDMQETKSWSSAGQNSSQLVLIGQTVTETVRATLSKAGWRLL